MKLLNVRDQSNGATVFCALIRNCAVSLATLGKRRGVEWPHLRDVTTYLANLPASEAQARELVAFGEEIFASLPESERPPLDEISILPPVEQPPALLDFGLTPRHLENSARTLFKHEFGRLVGGTLGRLIAKGVGASARRKMLYYKGNAQAVIGDGEAIAWPAYTSYLDIEPELAMVVGNEACPIGGYTIFNDSSARDVQLWEMIGTGPARSKDFDHSKGLGPFLVTPDDIADPLALAVRVTIGTRYVWDGNTAEYCARPEDALAFLRTIFRPLPGTIVGLGTIPGCTGLDHDLWIRPGETVAMTFASLGTLRQLVGIPTTRLAPSRWVQRQDLQAFY